MRTRTTIGLWTALGALALAGCAPMLRIQHRDRTHPAAAIRVNDAPRVTIRYGESMSLPVSEGTCSIQAAPPEGGRNPWTDDGRGWEIYLEDDADLILLAPPGPIAAPEPADEKGART